MTEDHRLRAWLPGAIGVLACAGMGAIMILGAIGIGPLGPEDINGPPWLGAVAGSLFLLMGAALLVAGSGRFRGTMWLLGGLMILCCALLGNWVAFGAGPRQCSGGVSFLFFSVSGPAAEIECRIAFGIGAVALDGVLLWGLGALLEGARGAGRLTALLQKAGKGILLAAILPLLLVALALQWAARLPARRRRGPPG